MGRLFVVLMVLWSFPVLAAETADSSANKNCWIEIYEDDNFDQDDPHVILEGPQEFATLKNLGGRDWTDDIESLIVGPGATVKAYSKRDFQGTRSHLYSESACRETEQAQHVQRDRVVAGNLCTTLNFFGGPGIAS